MDINKIVELIARYVREYDKDKSFQTAGEEVRNVVFDLPKSEFLSLLNQIGIIPESIAHDSKEEKLFAKVSEIFLARCYDELGFEATLFTARGNTADVLVRSKYHNYSLVADAKAFRLSRTAKNQKDFKVESMDTWRGDNDYAVLCCPYFQYPRKKSAIYKQALDRNVSLLSWEHFCFLLKNNVYEDIETNLSSLWDYGRILSSVTVLDKADNNFFDSQNDYIAKKVGKDIHLLTDILKKSKDETIKRGKSEIEFWQRTIEEIKSYDRDRAVNELIYALKLYEKIKFIDRYIKGLSEC